MVTDGISGQFVTVQSGDAIPLEPPPQGGYVVYAALKAKNFRPCKVLIEGRLRDLSSGAELGYEGRTTNFIATTDGWAEPELSDNSQVANVGVCPDEKTVDLQGQPALLEMTLTDCTAHRAVFTTMVVPTCGAGGTHDNCVCTCSTGYQPGKCPAGF